MAPVEAALDAAKLRLRPILMTAFAFILGVVPLVRAAGAGRRGPQGDGHGGLRRHARRHHPRRLPRPGALRRGRDGSRAAKKQEADAPGGASPAAQGGALEATREPRPARRRRAPRPPPARSRPPTSARTPTSPRSSASRRRGEAASIADLPWWEMYQGPHRSRSSSARRSPPTRISRSPPRASTRRGPSSASPAADFYPQMAGTARGGYGQPISDELRPRPARRGRSTRWRRARPGSSTSGAASATSSDAAFADLLATEDVRRAVVLSLVVGRGPGVRRAAGPRPPAGDREVATPRRARGRSISSRPGRWAASRRTWR